MNNKIAQTCPLLFSALLVALLAAGCSSVRTIDSQANYSQAQAQIERRLQEILLAAETKDFDRLESYHAYGSKFTRFSGSSPDRQDAAATRKLERDGLGALTGLKMRADALKIDVFGTVGIATFILDYSFRAGGATVRRKDRSTLVFAKENGAWRIVHEHLSPITLAESGHAVGA